MTLPPRIAIAPRTDHASAKTVWDGDSAILQTTFEYSPLPSTPRQETLRDQLDQRLGVRGRIPRVVLGDLDIAYRDDRRLESIELRTSVGSWQRGSVDDVPADAPNAWITFDVPFDENGIFSLDLPVSITWDAVADRLSLQFSSSAASRWNKLADAAAVGMSEDGTLVEMRLAGVEIRAAG